MFPAIDPKTSAVPLAKGIAASPGAVSGRAVFSADDAEAYAARDEQVILVRIETSPEDLHGMKAAKGILTARGGATSHAAVVARGMGRPCVSGCSALHIDYDDGVMTIHGPDGSKLSKRHGALGVDAYRAMGYLPAAMRNYLVRLGWSHGDQEIFSTEEMIAAFDLPQIGRSPARFDFAKLESLNGHYMRTSADADLVVALERLLPYLPEGGEIAKKLTPEIRQRLLAGNRRSIASRPRGRGHGRPGRGPRRPPG